jgi:PST family polysaccharide transporter
VVAGAALAAAVLLAVLAEQLVDVLYGERWGRAAVALRWLALFGGLRIVADLAYDLLAALGRGRQLLAVQGVWFVSLCVALPIAAQMSGIAGVALAQCLVTLVVVLPAYVAAVHRAGLSLAALWRSVSWPVVAAVAAASVMLAGRGAAWSGLSGVAVIAVAGIVTFGALMAAVPENWAAMQFARRRLAGRRVG